MAERFAFVFVFLTNVELKEIKTEELGIKTKFYKW